jgi:hypothetical protein
MKNSHVKACLDVCKYHRWEWLKMKVVCMILISVAACQQTSFARPQEIKDNALKKQAALLFEDTVSVGLRDFYKGKISNKTLIEFGIGCVVLHSPDSLRANGKNNNTAVPAKYVASIVQNYFGCSVHNESTVYFHYRNGNYYFDGDLFENLGKEDIGNLKLFRNDNGSYTFYGEVTDELGAAYDPHSKYNVAYRMELKRIGKGSKARFIITGWSSAKNNH